MLSCPVCGSTRIEKSMMTPRVNSSGVSESERHEKPERVDLTQPGSSAEQALAALRVMIEKNSEYVGRQFVSEARAISVGNAPERSITGEANLREATELIEDGIFVVPLPWRNPRDTN